MSLPAPSRSDSGPLLHRHSPQGRPATRSTALREAGSPKRFGPYLLLRAFAQGGMGQVFLAKRQGLRGIDRFCVVKKLRPDHASHDEYVRRFLDEARVVVQLNHANICHVFDVGQVDDEYYLAMEHVSGVTLRALFQRARKRGDSVPAELVLRGALDVLEALDYAHCRSHPTTGQPLHLVHRDVSPQNIMWSYDGDIKLIDFGLAASELKEEHTQDHVVMGKVAYMSPEQARGERVTAQADQFAAAIVLYELLTLERFYGALATHEIWQRAGRGDHAPERLHTLPPDVQEVLRRALHADPEARFPSCGAFRDALAATQLLRGGLRSRREIGEFVRDCFAAEYEEERVAWATFAQLPAENVDADAPRVGANDADEVRTEAGAQLEATAPVNLLAVAARDPEGTQRHPPGQPIRVWHDVEATSTAAVAERAFAGHRRQRRLGAWAATLGLVLVAGGWWLRAETSPAPASPRPASAPDDTSAPGVSPTAPPPNAATPTLQNTPAAGPNAPGVAEAAMASPAGAAAETAPRPEAALARRPGSDRAKAPERAAGAARSARPRGEAAQGSGPTAPVSAPALPPKAARAAPDANRGAGLSDVVRVQDLPADRTAERERWRAAVVTRLQACPATCARALLHPASALVADRPLDIGERDFSAISFSVERCLTGCGQ